MASNKRDKEAGRLTARQCVAVFKELSEKLRTNDELCAGIESALLEYNKAELCRIYTPDMETGREPFQHILDEALPAVMERYHDQRNMAKGKIPDDVGECLNLLAGEMKELADEMKIPTNLRNLRHETSDVVLTGLFTLRSIERCTDSETVV
jgi:NTP pyrophosphatase (non-canonical NTP hydrolase)